MIHVAYRDPEDPVVVRLAAKRNNYRTKAGEVVVARGDVPPGAPPTVGEERCLGPLDDGYDRLRAAVPDYSRDFVAMDESAAQLAAATRATVAGVLERLRGEGMEFHSAAPYFREQLRELLGAVPGHDADRARIAAAAASVAESLDAPLGDAAAALRRDGNTYPAIRNYLKQRICELL